MSKLSTIFSRLVAALFSTQRVPPEPETMSLRDWADLPPHHPAHDRAPC